MFVVSETGKTVGERSQFGVSITLPATGGEDEP